MSNANLPSDPADRRRSLSRPLIVGMGALVLLAAGYFLLRDTPASRPAPSDAQKDTAARFESIQGNVKTRGVGGLDWKTAAIDVPLRKSDLVRTYPASSAEIKFFDDTRVSIRPDSLITIEETFSDPNSTSGKIAWKISSGEINYETRKDSGSTEAFTPTFRLALEGNSAGTMRVGEGGLTAVAQLSGAANIETKTGEKIRLSANEGVRVDATGKAGAKQVLPETPLTRIPGDGSGLLSLPEGVPVSVSWSASIGSAAYRVQVEMKTVRGLESVFDGEGLKGTSVAVPGLTAGEFSFRVAGQTSDRVVGRFSDSVSFRVERTAAASPPPPVAASAPPFLIIDTFEARSNVLRLVGKTEPGSRLTVNGDSVAVQPDGSFREFVTLTRKQGEQRVVVRSTSPGGGVAEETRTLPPGQ